MLVKFIYVPIAKKYKSNRGLSERLIRKRLEGEGWEVWRGGFLHAPRMEVYPNVLKKYKRLEHLIDPATLDHLQYLCVVHHGMPDFLCYRDGFKFVECKLGHEQLSKVQKLCIPLLKKLGFPVEVHKMVFDCTKDRVALVNIKNGKK